jgi:hypothetical protein
MPNVAAGGTDAKFDWTNDTFYGALVGPYNNVPYAQNKTTHIHWSDISNYDIANQSGFTGNSPYAAGGVPLTTIAPYIDTSASPLIYAEFFASHSSMQAPASGSALNGFLFTNATYTGMQGLVIYRKGGATNTSPLLGYLDLCGGSISSTSSGTISNGQTTAIATASTTGFVVYSAGVNGGQVIILDSGSANWEANTIKSISAGVSITLNSATAHSYSASSTILMGNNAAGDKCEVLLGGTTGLFMQLIP